MKNIVDLLLKKFKNIFTDKTGEFSLFFAPGRINLIGEHTDYTGGLVFPAGIDYGTYIIAQTNTSKVINIASLNFEGKIETLDPDDFFSKTKSWTDYIKGVLTELKTHYKEDIYQGFDALVYGDLPYGAGLSSSASLEMASIVMFLGMNERRIPHPGSVQMIHLSQLAQRSENSFVGVNCGIMDQFASGNAKEGHAIKLDCSDLSYEYCPLDLGEYSILVSNTNKQRRLDDSQYNIRRKECEKGFEMLKKLGIKKKVLGKVSLLEWNKLQPKFSKHPVIKKRLNHVITENNRVKEAVKALTKNNIKKFASLINQSGDSLRNDFEVTGLHLDAMVDAARSTDGVIASRMTGAGFGGCTISIVKTSMVETVKKEIEKKYYDKTRIRPDFYLFKIGDGARKLEL
jgi:galactokinase